MQVVLIIFSVALLGVIINYATSPKSSRILKLAALGALGLIGLSLGIASLFIALNVFKKDDGKDHLPIFLEAPKEAASNRGNIMEIVIFLVFFVAVIGLIVVVASRDRKKRLEEAKKAPSSPMFPKTAKPAGLNLKDEEEDKGKDDDFHLDIG